LSVTHIDSTVIVKFDSQAGAPAAIWRGSTKSPVCSESYCVELDVSRVLRWRNALFTRGGKPPSWNYWSGVYCGLAEPRATYKDLNGKKQHCSE